MNEEAIMELYEQWQKICECTGTYDPLYLYGPAGMRKPHLLRAIAEEYQKQKKTAVCISMDQFAEEMIDAIKHGTHAEFRKKYRQVDVLLIDRLQYAAGKEATQEEVFNIIENRSLAHKHTVFAGNAHPAQMVGLDPELYACLMSGLCLEIPTPDLEGKAKIIYRKLKEHGIAWPMDACRYAALNISPGANQIEGEINKILLFREDLHMKNLPAGKVETVTTEILHELAVPAHTKGYQYLREAIIIAAKDMDVCNAMDKVLYPQVAKVFQTTPRRVIWAMRHAMSVMWRKSDDAIIAKHCGYLGGKPDPSQFIEALAEDVRWQLDIDI